MQKMVRQVHESEMDKFLGGSGDVLPQKMSSPLGWSLSSALYSPWHPLSNVSSIHCTHMKHDKLFTTIILQFASYVTERS